MGFDETVPEHEFHCNAHQHAFLEPFLHKLYTFEDCENNVHNAGRCLKLESLSHCMQKRIIKDIISVQPPKNIR